jgi:hypothetical protein
MSAHAFQRNSMFRDLLACALFVAVVASAAVLGGCETDASTSPPVAMPTPPPSTSTTPQAPFDDTVITPVESAGAPRWSEAL